MKKVFYILFFLSLAAAAQDSGVAGVYGDWTGPDRTALTTELELRKDGTFCLRTVDPVYPQTFASYINEGGWISKGREVILNPDLEKREPTVRIIEKQTGSKDSISIRIRN